jgi:hypothetical protein
LRFRGKAVNHVRLASVYGGLCCSWGLESETRRASHTHSRHFSRCVCFIELYLYGTTWSIALNTFGPFFGGGVYLRGPRYCRPTVDRRRLTHHQTQMATHARPDAAQSIHLIVRPDTSQAIRHWQIHVAALHDFRVVLCSREQQEAHFPQSNGGYMAIHKRHAVDRSRISPA